MALPGLAELVTAVEKEVSEIDAADVELATANAVALEAQAVAATKREAADAERSQAVSALQALATWTQTQIEALRR